MIEKFDLKKDNRNIKVVKNCPTLVTVLTEFSFDRIVNVNMIEKLVLGGTGTGDLPIINQTR